MKALQSGFFVWKFRKHFVKMRDFQDFLNVSLQPHHSHLAAALQNHHVNSRQFSDSRTVQINQSAQIEDKVLAALCEEARHVFP